ncbi:MAG: undecaprenyl-diphosphate phosphatase [Candidatus Methanodesulfokora sp.]|jgi:undecaprenyl-diphosphatase
MDSISAALMLGIVQGISEWLPISSKTQIMIVSSLLLGLNMSEAYSLGLFLESGSLLAAIIYFYKEIKEMLLGVIGRSRMGFRMFLYLVVVTLITGLVGVPLYLFVEENIRGFIIGIPMILLGTALIFDSLIIKISNKGRDKRFESTGIKHWLVVGISQGIAALPGISRSGMTTSAMLFMGLSAEEAFRLSFLALIPASAGASALTLIMGRSTYLALGRIGYAGALAAMLSSTLVSLAVIRSVLEFARRSRVYRITFFLGAIAIISGVLSLLTGL